MRNYVFQVINVKSAVQALSIIKKIPKVLASVQSVIELVDAYCRYLIRKRKQLKTESFLETTLEKRANVHVCKIRKNTSVNRHILKLNGLLEESAPYSPININSYIDIVDRRRRLDLIEEIRLDGMNLAAVLYVHCVGGGKGNQNFI